MVRIRLVPVLLALSLGFLAGCASSGAPQSGMAANQAMVSVERFLQAANSSDLEAMANVFGTAAGPVADRTGNPLSCGLRRLGSWVRVANRCTKWTDIELWMSSIASIIRHDDARIQSESSVPGRENRTVRVGVDLQIGDRTIPDVAFVVVQARRGAWFVEEIDLERITSEDQD
ncbi:MAG: hypothetical protein EA352_08505 [Gemmatimonadales bacterium]|nr:MAG: hypothetical protein EA352_08505 [Gemmatimonadales bacterium]